MGRACVKNVAQEDFELEWLVVVMSFQLEPSRAMKVPSQAEPSWAGALQFSSWNQADNMYINKYKIFQIS